MVASCDLECRNKTLRQIINVAAHVTVDAVGVIFHRVLFDSTVRHPLFAVVSPAERRFDAVAGIVSEGQRDRPGWSDTQGGYCESRTHGSVV